jgi:hypothetical protein
MPYEGVKPNYGFIDTTGKVVIPFQFNQAGTSSFENGECRAVINGVTCLINTKGEVIFKPTLTKNNMGFYNNLCASYTNYNNRSGWGYYNRNNQWVIKPQYDNAQSFENGLAVVEKAGKYGVIDTSGKFILPMKYASIFGGPKGGYYGTEMVMNGPKEYFKPDGTPFTKIAIKYLMPDNGHKLYPYVTDAGKYGFLNADGTIFTEARFDYASSFEEGKCFVRGYVADLKKANGVSDESFFKEYTVNEQVKAQKGGKGTFLPATIKQIGEHYYLVEFTDRTQEWITGVSIKR